MKISRRILIVIVFLGLLIFPILTLSQQDEIIINDADAMVDHSVVVSQDLLNLLPGVEPRYIIENANYLAFHPLPVVPSNLQILINQVTPRIKLLNAETNRTFLFSYPAELIGDNTPPQISQEDIFESGLGELMVVWDTNEFADSTVVYGTQPGAYTNSIHNQSYVLQHAVQLSDLNSGVTYYLLIRSTDRSGNISESPEYSYLISPSDFWLYIPISIRN